MIRAIRAWLASLDPEALRRSRFEPCSDYDEEFTNRQPLERKNGQRSK